jgi:hypothetical protein
VRTPLLKKLKDAGASKWFAGHTHVNCGGWSGENFEVVVSAACGVVVDPALQDVGAQSPNLPNGRLGPDVSGLRLVCVDKGVIGHRWFTHDSVPESVDPAADAQAWAAAGDVVSKL